MYGYSDWRPWARNLRLFLPRQGFAVPLQTLPVQSMCLLCYVDKWARSPPQATPPQVACKSQSVQTADSWRHACSARTVRHPCLCSMVRTQLCYLPLHQVPMSGLPVVQAEPATTTTATPLAAITSASAATSFAVAYASASASAATTVATVKTAAFPDDVIFGDNLRCCEGIACTTAGQSRGCPQHRRWRPAAAGCSTPLIARP